MTADRANRPLSGCVAAKVLVVDDASAAQAPHPRHTTSRRYVVKALL